MSNHVFIPLYIVSLPRTGRKIGLRAEAQVADLERSSTDYRSHCSVKFRPSQLHNSCKFEMEVAQKVIFRPQGLVGT